MTERKRNQKQAGFEIKTFTVPFALEGNQENITIFTNTHKKLSKEQIIKQAFDFHSKGNIQKAAKYYQYFINQGFTDPIVFSNYGAIQEQLGEIDKAIKIYQKSVHLFPKSYESHSNLGKILREKGELKKAEIHSRIAIELKPDSAETNNNLGLVLKDIGRLKEAEVSLLKAIEINPTFAQAHCNLGIILKDLNNLREAEFSTRKAIEINPTFAQAYYNLGNILIDIGNLEEAESSYRKAIELNPNFAEAYSNLGNILIDIGDIKEAESAYRKALHLNPYLADAHNNLGMILDGLGKLEEAYFSIKKAVKISPNSTIINYNLALNLINQRKLRESINIFKRILDQNPNNEKIIAEMLLTASKLSDFDIINRYASDISKLGTNKFACDPYKFFHLEDNPKSHLKRAINFYKEKYKGNAKRINYIKKEKIHIGYFSADFRSHPVMYLIKRILELHDRSKFKVYIYSFTKEEDEYTQSLKKEHFYFRSIYEKSDLEAVEIARNDNLDIAIDLMGYTKNNRMRIFSYRVSPIQICYLCSTTGSKELDYLIGDKVLIPKKFQEYYSEKILYMPNSFMCFDDTRKISKKYFTRAELNLPDNAFVMAAFHQNHKITIKEIESWSRILNNISNAILWISSTNKIAEENILKAFKKRGVSIDHILFAPRMKSNEEHLSRHSCADLFVDTFNWNANSTSIDSLWLALPVVTLLGKSYLARTSASCLTTLGLTELIANTPQEYEDIIISLAKEPKKLREIKNKLINSKYKNPLFNSKLFTEDLEKIYCSLVDN